MNNRQVFNNHKHGSHKRCTRSFIVAIISVLLLSEAGWSIQNPFVQDPIGLTYKFPIGHARQSLVPSPDPFDDSANWVIHGNVSGGRHFRAYVGYGSPRHFMGPLPSVYLRSFIQYSAGMEDVGQYAGKYRSNPYHETLSDIATKMSPGRRSIDTKLYSRAVLPAAGGVGGASQSGWIGKYFFVKDDAAIIDEIRSWPMSRSLAEMERLITAETGRFAGGGGLSEESEPVEQETWLTGDEQVRTRSSYASALKAIQPSPMRLTDRAADLKLAALGAGDTLSQSVKSVSGEQILAGGSELTQTSRAQISEELYPRYYASDLKTIRDLKNLQAALPTGTEKDEYKEGEVKGQVLTPQQKNKAFEIYERIKKQIDDLQKRYEQKLEAKEEKTAREASETSQTRRRAQSDIQQEPFTGSTEERESSITQPKEFTGVDTTAQAQRVLAEYKNLTSFAEEKFNQYVEAAEVYLKQGRYYRALDSYSLAAIYKPHDPRANMGKSHVLFAAGEYISSALFLSRALEDSPEMVRSNIDFVELLGDSEKLNSRIADVEECLKRSGAAELEFLLGYVYYHLGNLSKAKETIDTAYVKLPKSPAVETLRQAIIKDISAPAPRK